MTRPASAFNRDYADEQLRRSRHPFRRLIKGFYLRSVLRDVIGPTIDFGCGAGQLLSLLPSGSVGLEVNPDLIRELARGGLDVRLATGTDVDFELRELDPGRYQTVVVAHVLEHIQDPRSAMMKLFDAGKRLGLCRIIVVVPSRKGFASDQTHATFVDRNYLASNGLLNGDATYRLTKSSYFPLPWEFVGKHFTYHELKLVYDRNAAQ